MDRQARFLKRSLTSHGDLGLRAAEGPQHAETFQMEQPVVRDTRPREVERLQTLHVYKLTQAGIADPGPAEVQVPDLREAAEVRESCVGDLRIVAESQPDKVPQALQVNKPGIRCLALLNAQLSQARQVLEKGHVCVRGPRAPFERQGPQGRKALEMRHPVSGV